MYNDRRARRRLRPREPWAVVGGRRWGGDGSIVRWSLRDNRPSSGRVSRARPFVVGPLAPPRNTPLPSVDQNSWPDAVFARTRIDWNILCVYVCCHAMLHRTYSIVRAIFKVRLYVSLTCAVSVQQIPCTPDEQPNRLLSLPRCFFTRFIHIFNRVDNIFKTIQQK